MKISKANVSQVLKLVAYALSRIAAWESTTATAEQQITESRPRYIGKTLLKNMLSTKTSKQKHASKTIAEEQNTTSEKKNAKTDPGTGQKSNSIFHEKRTLMIEMRYRKKITIATLNCRRFAEFPNLQQIKKS